MTPDPIGLAGGINLYAYTSNNPINSIDPLGLETVLILTTERNPKRDPVNPWGHVAEYAKQREAKRLKNKYEKLDILTNDINRVQQLNDALVNNKDIVSVIIIGHSSRDAINVGNEALSGTNISSAGGKNDVSPSTLDWNNLTEDASIEIWGCHAGDGDNSIAQDMASAAGVQVLSPDAYLNFADNGKPFIRWFRFGDWVLSKP